MKHLRYTLQLLLFILLLYWLIGQLLVGTLRGAFQTFDLGYLAPACGFVYMDLLHLTMNQDQAVAQMYRARGVNVIDATETLTDIPLEDRVISNRDIHLTKYGHEKLASLL
jgi:hypothetical protein